MYIYIYIYIYRLNGVNIYTVSLNERETHYKDCKTSDCLRKTKTNTILIFLFG